MIERIALESVALFLAPFALYVVFLLLRWRYPLEVEHWTRGRVGWMSVAGLALALLFFLVLELTAPRAQGRYVPAHEENGVLVPGRFQ